MIASLYSFPLLKETSKNKDWTSAFVLFFALSLARTKIVKESSNKHPNVAFPDNNYGEYCAYYRGSISKAYHPN